MPLIQSQVLAITPGTVIDNVFSGSQFEFLPYDAVLEFGFTAGTTPANARIDVYSGQDVLCESLTPSAAARIPIYPDDFNLNDVAAAGERVKLRVRNVGAAGNVDLYFALKITPA